MSVVWKFKVHTPDALSSSIVFVPEGAELLSVGLEQDDTMVIWAAVDKTRPVAMRRLIVVNTGDEFDSSGHFIGTVRTSTQVVWHVFEEIS